MLNPIPNLHHLELFYHVARAGGITAATRSMPYGIQQPAVSGQISSLEAELGVRLFQRRPFRLTPTGEELYGFLAPFFGKLPMVAASISGRASKHMRLSAPTMLIREHLPGVIVEMRKRQPDLELSLVEASRERSIELLEKEEVDLAVVEMEGKPPAQFHSRLLVELSPVLLLPPGLKKPRDGVGELAGKVPLVRVPEATVLARLFEKGLGKSGLNWAPDIEVSSVDVVASYVAKGFGCGLSVDTPEMSLPKRITKMKLTSFPKMRIYAMWCGKIHPLAAEALRQLVKIGKEMG